MASLKVGLLQYTAKSTETETAEIIFPMMEDAKNQGAELIALPECATRLDPDRNRLKSSADTLTQSEILKKFCAFAEKHKVWLSLGSMVLKPEDSHDDRLVNRSIMISPDGVITATYDKIHMFDVVINADESYQESATYQPGKRAVITPMDDVRVGMTICYDLRFPQLYQDLAKAGASVMLIPSAFTVATGKAHWEVLLRARAIETGSFVIAAAQTGTHDEGPDGSSRLTYGHSMVVSPWGDVLASLKEESGICMATLNLNSVRQARRRLPVLDQQRQYNLD